MLKRAKSFGLIETLIACGILVMVSGATTSLGIISIRGSVLARDRAEAVYLAQEAMEEIKYQRDLAWEKENWDKFWNDSFGKLKTDLESKCVFIDHSSGTLKEDLCSASSPPAGIKYTRKISKEAISVSDVPANNAYKVSVTVEWTDYNQSQSVVLASYLTNWQPRY